MTSTDVRELLTAKLKQHEQMIHDTRAVLGDLAWNVGVLLIQIEKQEGTGGLARAVRDMPDSALAPMAHSFVADLARALLRWRGQSVSVGTTVGYGEPWPHGTAANIEWLSFMCPIFRLAPRGRVAVANTARCGPPWA